MEHNWSKTILPTVPLRGWRDTASSKGTASRLIFRQIGADRIGTLSLAVRASSVIADYRDRCPQGERQASPPSGSGRHLWRGQSIIAWLLRSECAGVRSLPCAGRERTAPPVRVAMRFGYLLVPVTNGGKTSTPGGCRSPKRRLRSLAP